ncbi:MAG: GtrA family protein [bacterium]|nr:GtrA family protein [bacterium]
MFESLITTFMPMEVFWELFYYGLSGVAATIVSQVGYSVCFRKFALSNVWSKSLSWLAAATVAFFMMRYLAFSGTQEPFLDSLWKTFYTRIGTVLLTVFIMWLVMDIWLKWDLRDRSRLKEYGKWPEIINLAVTLFEIALNYLIAKFYVF